MLQPAIERQSAATAASAPRPGSDLVLIDVGLLFDTRLPVAFLFLGVELPVPPQRPAFFLLLDDVRLGLEQLADHAGEVGFVGLGHGFMREIIRPLPSSQRLYINTDMEGLP